MEKGKQTFEDDTEGALADLSANAVVAADEVWRGGVVLGRHGCRGRGRDWVVKIIRLELTTPTEQPQAGERDQTFEGYGFGLFRSM